MKGFVEILGTWLAEMCALAFVRIEAKYQRQIAALEESYKNRPQTWWSRLWETKETLEIAKSWEEASRRIRFDKVTTLKANSICETVNLDLEMFAWIHGWAGRPERP